MDEKNSNPDKDNFEEIEEILRGLEPTGISPGFLQELERDRHNITSLKARENGQIILSRFIPLAAAACLVIAGVFAHRLGYFDWNKDSVVAGKEKPTQLNEVSPEDAHLIHGLPPLGESGRFRPVSAEGVITDSREGDIVSFEENGGVPMREENLEVWDIYIYADPETGTRIRQYVPRSVTTLKPVVAD